MRLTTVLHVFACELMRLQCEPCGLNSNIHMKLGLRELCCRGLSPVGSLRAMLFLLESQTLASPGCKLQTAYDLPQASHHPSLLSGFAQSNQRRSENFSLIKHISNGVSNYAADSLCSKNFFFHSSLFFSLSLSPLNELSHVQE